MILIHTFPSVYHLLLTTPSIQRPQFLPNVHPKIRFYKSSDAVPNFKIVVTHNCLSSKNNAAFVHIRVG